MRTVREYQEERRLHYQKIRDEIEHDKPIDVMCETCLVELRDMSPGFKLMSYPPQFRATCPNCKTVYLLYA